MNKAATNLPRRYPGLKPFERGQTAVFHGRQEDVQVFANLVLRERLVVLFAKSGIGKTSLLQAGCAPELERQDFAPIFLRVDRIDSPILDHIGEVIENNPFVNGVNRTGLRTNTPQTLWEKMKRFEFDLDGLPATPVLVLDQFEEAFTLSHSAESRNQFFSELADLANETMPEVLRSTLLAQFEKGEIDVKTMQWWEQQPEVRIVLSIRSDFLHMVDRVSKSIPGILRNRYELLPLNQGKALSAIEKPAMQLGEYASQPFHYAPAALEEILDFLAGRDAAQEDGQMPTRTDEIETVNLQIICQSVEERLIEARKVTGFEVDKLFYGEKEGLRNSIRNFYQNQLSAFPKAYTERILQKTEQGSAISSLDQTLAKEPHGALHLTAQRIIEESLVTPGNRRNSVVDDTLLSEYQVSPDFLDTLVDKSRLLRKEPRLDDFYYEISHDTLLPVVIESRKNRREVEQAAREKAELETRIAEAAKALTMTLQLKIEAERRESVEAELVATRRQRRLARMVALTSFLSLTISLMFGIWFVNDYVKNARNQLRQAEFYVHNELYDAAIPAYEDLLRSPRRRWVLEEAKPNKDLSAEYEIVKKFEHAYQVVQNRVVNADSMMFVGDYRQVLASYRQASDSLEAYQLLNVQFSPDSTHGRWRVGQDLILKKKELLEARISMVQSLLIRDFKVSQREYESYAEAGEQVLALRSLYRIQRLLPEHDSDEAELQRSLGSNQLPSVYVQGEIAKTKSKTQRK